MPTELFTEFLRLPLFALIVGRLAGLLMFLPMFGGMAIAPQVRALLVLGLAALMTPIVRQPTGMPADVIGMLTALVGEFGLGVVMGLAVRTCFAGLQIGAQLISQESGVAFAQIVDPNNGVESDMLGVFYAQIGGVIFLIVGGHRAIVDGALGSLSSVPLMAASPDPGAAANLLIETLTTGCELGMRLAAPILVTLLLVNVALGFVARTLPQLNVVTVGCSIKGLLAFLIVAVTLPIGMECFTSVLEDVVALAQSFVDSAG